jgi:hypothetical protein
MKVWALPSWRDDWLTPAMVTNGVQKSTGRRGVSLTWRQGD